MKKYIGFTIFLLLFLGCDSPFDPTERYTGQEVSIQYLKSQYKHIPMRLTEDYIIRGRVVSSDRHGNFKWTLAVEDDTGGIEVKIGLNPYCEQFQTGQEVRVKCAGLVLGAYGGTIQLGAASTNPQYETGFINEGQIGEHILSAGGVQKITPTGLGVGEFSMRYVNCAVRLEGVQLTAEEIGLSWGDGLNYTERYFQFLSSPEVVFSVRTSPSADFAGETMPSESGTLEGVLTQFAGKFSLVLNQPPELTGDRQTF